MRSIGHRKERPISYLASAVLLLEGARFNDEMHRLPTGNTTFVPKGLYRFNTLDETNSHQQDCLLEVVVQIALKRS